MRRICNMNENKHTEGPWEYKDSNGHIYGDVGGLDFESVAVIKPIIYSQGEETKEANAHLIAAAPEMLEELVKAVKIIENSDAWWIDCPDKGGFDLNALTTIINKAKGELK